MARQLVTQFWSNATLQLLEFNYAILSPAHQCDARDNPLLTHHHLVSNKISVSPPAVKGQHSVPRERVLVRWFSAAAFLRMSQWRIPSLCIQSPPWPPLLGTSGFRLWKWDFGTGTVLGRDMWDHDRRDARATMGFAQVRWARCALRIGAGKRRRSLPRCPRDAREDGCDSHRGSIIILCACLF